eukprot:7833377-Prorocentrum_lima.AAC.1
MLCTNCIGVCTRQCSDCVAIFAQQSLVASEASATRSDCGHAEAAMGNGSVSRYRRLTAEQSSISRFIAARDGQEDVA